MKKNCVICGSEFQARGPKKTCGITCSKDLSKKTIRQWEKDNADHVRKRKRVAARRRYWLDPEAARVRARTQRGKDPERVREQERAYYRRSRVKLGANAKRWRSKNRDYFRQYYVDNIEQMRGQARACARKKSASRREAETLMSLVKEGVIK